MTNPDWARPHWARDEAKALLVYFVFGRFEAELKLDLTAHGSAGLPVGVELRRIPKATLAHWDGHPLRGSLGETLRDASPAAFDAARKAPECLLLRGELPDPDSLEYLRDTLGVITGLLDVGGVAVVDPQILEIFSAADWRARHGGDAGSTVRNHVLVLCHDDSGGRVWVKTRGMRKFARPDISIRQVPAAAAQKAGVVAARLAELEAHGMRFGDASTLAVDGLPDGLRLTRGGSLDDPEFNNTHLEITWTSA